MSNFEIRKEVFFQKQQKHKKFIFQWKLQLLVERLFASLNIHYNNNINAEVQKQNEPK